MHAVLDVLTSAAEPMTPTHVKKAVETKLGREVSISTVKTALSSHAANSASAVQRLKGGRYELQQR